MKIHLGLLLLAGWACVGAAQRSLAEQDPKLRDEQFWAQLTPQDLKDTVWQSHNLQTGISTWKGVVYYAVRMLGRKYAPHGLNSVVTRLSYEYSGLGCEQHLVNASYHYKGKDYTLLVFPNPCRIVFEKEECNTPSRRDYCRKFVDFYHADPPCFLAMKNGGARHPVLTCPAYGW